MNKGNSFFHGTEVYMPYGCTHICHLTLKEIVLYAKSPCTFYPAVTSETWFNKESGQGMAVIPNDKFLYF